jgi:hypothetical protein
MGGEDMKRYLHSIVNLVKPIGHVIIRIIGSFAGMYICMCILHGVYQEYCAFSKENKSEVYENK